MHEKNGLAEMDVGILVLCAGMVEMVPIRYQKEESI